MEPTHPPATAPEGASTESALREAEAEAQAEARRQQRRRKMLQRVEAQPDFASTQNSLAGIQKVARSDRAHARALTHLIDDDPAMVGKLLRLINAAYYSSAGGGQITSMARAVALMGFQPVSMLASSLLMFERLPKGSDGDALRREFARAQLAALLAHEFCHDRRHLEHAYVAALFHRLGEMLGGMHFADEIQIIDDHLEDQELAPGTPEYRRARQRLARERWGQSIEELAVELSEGWGWPSVMQTAMRPLAIDGPERVLEGDEYLRALCTASNDLAEDVLRLPPPAGPDAECPERTALLARFAQTCAPALGLGPEGLAERLGRVQGVWGELMSALGVRLAVAEAAGSAAAAAPVTGPGMAQRQRLAENLADAVDHITRMNHRRAPLEEVLQATLELLQKSLGLQRALACLREGEPPVLCGHAGVGAKAVVLAPLFRIPLEPPADLFGLLCVRNADTLISDTSDPVIANRLPEWFHRKVRAGTFLILPLVAEGRVLGMIYGDQQAAGALHVHERALTLLRNLRQQVTKAAARREGGTP